MEGNKRLIWMQLYCDFIIFGFVYFVAYFNTSSSCKRCDWTTNIARDSQKVKQVQQVSHNSFPPIKFYNFTNTKCSHTSWINMSLFD